jgi:hypothetical protein
MISSFAVRYRYLQHFFTRVEAYNILCRFSAFDVIRSYRRISGGRFAATHREAGLPRTDIWKSVAHTQYTLPPLLANCITCSIIGLKRASAPQRK